MKNLTILLFITIVSHSMIYGATYYSQGSFVPEMTGSWNDSRTGGGNSPLNFSSGDLFVVQANHIMASEASWSVSGTGSGLWIENGGTLTANWPITLAKATVFTIENGGTFIHNNVGTPSSTIFNGTENFSQGSTFWIKNWIGNLYVLPYGITWGNLIIDVPSLTGSWNQVGNVTTVNGTLDIRQTGGNANEFRLCSRTSLTYTFSIANINVSGGILDIQGGGTTGLPAMYTTVTSDLTVSGGKLDLGANGTSILSLGGNLAISGTGTIITSGATSRLIFNKSGIQNVCLTAGGMSTNLINVDINSESRVSMGSAWVLSPLSTLNIYGSLNTNGYLLKPRALNVGGILNLGNGLLEQTGTAAIIVGGPSLGNTGTINCSGVINMSSTSFSSFLVQPGGVVNLDNGTINMNHSGAVFFIDTGGTLNCGTGKVASVNSTLSSFILNPGGTLGIGSPEGISLSEPTGNIQVGGSRSFHFAANYLYAGSTAQVTGNGLPNMVNDLTINNESGVSLSGDVLVNGCLRLISGIIPMGEKILSYGGTGSLEYNGPNYTTTTSVEFPSVNGPFTLVINDAVPGGLILHANRTIAGSLTIADMKKFIVPSGTNLTVKGTTTLNGNECLEIKSDCSFIDGGTLSSGTGSAIVERYVTTNAWHYISSPLQTALSAVFLGDFIKPYAEGTLGFGPNIVSTSTLLNPLQGYALWPGIDHTAAFTGGALNTGTLEAEVTRTYTGQSGDNEYDGWNLAGNPYPCTVDLDVVHNTWENVEETAYFWDQSLSAAGNYSVYPAMTGIGTHSQYVPPMQGFFVRCNAVASHEVAGTGTIRFNNASKVHSSEIFLKEKKEAMNTLFARVTGSANNYADELIIHFDSNATAGYDPGYDAQKLWGLNEAPQLFTTTNDNTRLTVNTLPFEKAQVVIAMKFKCGIPGIYELKFDSISSFKEEISVILEDLKLQHCTDLRSNPAYSFFFSMDDPENRFLFHFFNPRLGTLKTGKQQPINIYSVGSDILIHNTSEESFSGSLFLYDLSGRELLSCFLKNEQKNRIKTNLGSGCYVLKIISNLGIINKSLYLNNHDYHE